jgi:dTDP-glucose 4,6-dehydratase
LNKYPDIHVINVDLLTYAGNIENIQEPLQRKNHTFIKADIRDVDTINQIFSKYSIEKVVHFAAESHVDRSIEEPEIFISTNILGTQILLDVARKNWNMDPSNKYSKNYKSNVKFIQVSTDEVYGTLEETGKFLESMPLLPNGPYSASKASADLIVRAYHETYGLPVNITRCSNNYGPYQFPEKLILLIIYNALQKKALPVYGDGLQVRDWIHVLDHCAAIDLVVHKGVDGEIYNIGGDNEKTNVEIVRFILATLGMSESLIKYVPDRPGHDRRYAIDHTKITSQLGWMPRISFELGMKETIEWCESEADCYTDPEQAKYFIEHTGVDALAISFGTTHGVYLTEPTLDLSRISKIKEKIDIPFVMHGGSGVSDADFRIAIQNGISKINYFTYMSMAGGKAVTEFLKKQESKEHIFFHDISLVALAGMKENVRHAMRVFYHRSEGI